MIHVYTWPTPNGHKIHIMLEETGVDYEIHPVNISEGDQFEPAFLAISPNNRMPAIVDDDGPDGKSISIFESGAILIYLAEKTGQFMPGMDDLRGRMAVLEWLMFQMGGVGPMLGQNHHFRAYAPEKIPYAIDRYTNEAKRLYGVLDRRLGETPFLAGSAYSIADMATFPWLRSHERQGVALETLPNVKRWFDEIAARPAVERGLAILSEERRQGPITDKAREVLFGATQYQSR